MTNEAMLNKIISVSKDGIHIVNKDGKTTHYNRKMEILENRKTKDLKGFPLEGIDMNQNDKMMLDALQTGLPRVNQVYKGISIYGKLVVCGVSIWPLTENQEVVGVIKIVTDNTEVKNLRNKVLGITKDLNQIAHNTEKNQSANKYRLRDIIGESQQIQYIREISSIAAMSDANIMIYGESGTGKELVAQGIHNESRRKNKPFVAENCAAIPGNLMESIFFGTTKGGFTGAIDRPGLFQLANGGTLVLDEINSLDVGLQAKLLRVLQEGVFRPIGSVENRYADVRVIAISNKNPQTLIEEGTLRQDLFYRLNVIDIYVPSLREREGDIGVLTNYFIEKYGKKLNRFPASISEEVVSIFKKYPWHGNVRELSNVIECGINMMGDKKIIELQDLPNYFLQRVETTKQANRTVEERIGEIKEEKLSFSAYMSRIETDLINKAMSTHRGNITKAAESLGMSRQGLQHRIKKIEGNANNSF